LKTQGHDRKSDHLLLAACPTEQKGNPGNLFFERDWSLAWANFLLQEVGSYALSSIKNLGPQSLSQRHFVYLPSSLEETPSSQHQAYLKSFLENGGTVVVEGAGVHSLGFGELRFGSEKRPLTRITKVGGGAWPSPLVELLLRMPFKTFGWKIDSCPKEAEVILEMEGAPVLFRQRIGRGEVLALGFDFGLLLVGLQQGIPVKGEYRLRKLFGTQNRVIEPEDLVLKASLLDNPVPWADLFERFLFKVITSGRPAPRWWYFPSGYTGAFISTHDEEAIGLDPRLEAMCETEKSLGVRGNLFVISDPKLHDRWKDNGALRKWQEGEGPEIGLHWNRFEKPRLKLRRFQFGMHEEPLEQQKRILERLVGEPIQTNRTHYLALGTRYGEHFESLADHGILFDSTYGPNQGGRGYLFGTAYPYYGLTWQGSLSGVLELPFISQETWGGANLSFLERLITESDENFHQCLVTNFHPHYTVLKEAGRETWLGSLRLAKEKNQWMPTLGEFFKFFSERNASPFQSRFDGRNLEVSVEARGKQGALSFPYHTSGGKRLSRLEVDGVLTASQKLFNAWSEEVLIPIPQGTHQIRAVYEG